jgi:hypothetical protein
MLYHSHSPIKAALADLMRTIRFLISRYCTLKNTAVFLLYLCKIMLIYDQHSHQSLSNVRPLEAHHSVNTLDIFLKLFSNEKAGKKKFDIGDTVRINRTRHIFEKGNYLWSTEFFYDYELEEVGNSGIHQIE